MKSLNTSIKSMAVALGLAFAAAGPTHAAGTVGSSLPGNFPTILDASLGVPVIGFGARGSVTRTPVVFLHGNGGTPYSTGCGSMSANIQGMAQHFADKGYVPSELWALGYQGTQCDLLNQPANLSGDARTVAANVVDLRKFLKAVVSYTGARKVDIVAHGMGVVLTRELARQDNGVDYVRRFVAIEGPNQGMNICAAVEKNSWALAMHGGYTPTSPVCQEIGAPNTAFLKQLNFTDRRIPGASTMVIRNGDMSVLYRTGTDGLLAQGAPEAVDSFGNPFDFSNSPMIEGAAKDIVKYGEYSFDNVNWTSHVGIANDPATWDTAFDFLAAPDAVVVAKPGKRK